MSPAPTAAGDHGAACGPSPGEPGKRFTQLLFAAMAVLLALLLSYVIAGGPAFKDFPDRTIGISLLSDVNPYYRTLIFLLLSALAIVASGAIFALTRIRPGCSRPLPLNSTTALLLACALANAAAFVLHPDSSLFRNASGHCALLLALWGWHCHTSKGARQAEIYLLRLGLAWQGATLIMWLGGLAPGLLFYGPFLVLYLLAGLLSAGDLSGRGRWQRLHNAVSAWVLCAPILLVIAIEWAYFSQGSAVRIRHTLAVFGGLSLLGLFATALLARPRAQAWFAALCMLLTTFIVNQYDNEILFKGYDIFHLAEKMLPLQQWESYGSLPFRDYNPGHGLFDVLPHGAYQLFNRGNPLEALLWGNGYFLGWTVQTIYIGLFYICLSRFTGPVVAFLLLWLLPVFHLLDPYNTLLLLPVLQLTRLPHTRRPLAWWSLQWLLTLALGLWRADFGLIVMAGNLITLLVMAWYRRDLVHPVAATASLAGLGLLLALGILAFASDDFLPLLAITRDLMSILVLAASYDHFYQEWNYLASMQYIVLPALGAVAGGYSLARVYLRADHRQLATHLVVIFVTAIGFALSIRLFQRHTIVEGFTKTNFFYLAALLAFLTLRMRRGWRGPVAAVLVMAAFLAVPKTMQYNEKSQWSPRRSYPATTHDYAYPELARPGVRLVDKVTKYAAFQDFASQYLAPGQAFYDFANAPLLYMLADIKLPVYVYETVWHTSETLQDATLAELEKLREQGDLPFVVFRQNKQWDALDGVDNALRSYKMAEYIYQHYRPCLKIRKLELWTDQRLDCRGSYKNRIAAGSPSRRSTRFLAQDYLEQFIEFRHLPYIWANHDSGEDAVEQVIALHPESYKPGVIALENAEPGVCRHSACYLDLVIESPVTQEVPLAFNAVKQLSFTARAGRHRYRIRISALWRWHQQIDSEALSLQPEQALLVDSAQLVQLAPWRGKRPPQAARAEAGASPIALAERRRGQ